MAGDRSDEDLAVAARAGDEQAYANLVHRMVRPALAVAWEFAGDPDDAEDLVQDAFHRVVRALPRYDASRPFRPWFFTILRNLARNHLATRARWMTAPVGEVVLESEVDPLIALERDEVWERVEAGMHGLPAMQQSVFRLVDLEGMSGREVAEALGIAEGTVRAHLFRARRALRAGLEPVRDQPMDNG